MRAPSTRWRAAQKALAERQNHSLLVLADLIGGVADIRCREREERQQSRLAAQKSRHDSDDAWNRIGWPRSKERLRSRKAGTIRRCRASKRRKRKRG